MKIVLQNLTKKFPSRGKGVREDVVAVRDFSFEIPDGKLIGLLGPSGCGKSTTLNLLCGLQKPTSGRIFFGDDDVTALPAEKRGVGFVFQSYALYPHLTVLQNILFPLENLKGKDRLSKEAMREKAYEAARLVQIDELMDRKPSELSGGQQQRVAIARALAANPKILLSDEATSALDPDATESILALLKELNRKLGITIVIITHEMAVIKAIAHRVAVMEEGRVVEEGSVYDIFSSPKAPITRKFIASASPLGKIDRLMAKDSALVHVQPGELLVKLTFQKECASEHVLTTAARRFGFDLNIVLANMEYLHGNPLGGMIGILSGEAQNMENGIRFLAENHVTTEVLKDGSAD